MIFFAPIMDKEHEIGRSRLRAVRAGGVLLVLIVSALSGLPAPGLSEAVEGHRPQFAKSHVIVETDSERYTFDVEVARTPEERQFGLQFRDRLPRGEGMLFILEGEREATMWMKNTHVPLDIVFIRGDGEIANIAERTVPLSLSLIRSHGPVRGVLEVPAGTAARLDINRGDHVLHDVFGNVPRSAGEKSE